MCLSTFVPQPIGQLLCPHILWWCPLANLCLWTLEPFGLNVFAIFFMNDCCFNYVEGSPIYWVVMLYGDMCPWPCWPSSRFHCQATVREHSTFHLGMMVCAIDFILEISNQLFWGFYLSKTCHWLLEQNTCMTNLWDQQNHFRSFIHMANSAIKSLSGNKF